MPDVIHNEFSICPVPAPKISTGFFGRADTAAADHEVDICSLHVSHQPVTGTVGFRVAVEDGTADGLQKDVSSIG